MFNINLNEAKNGIEIRFEEKPESGVLVALKENGFRWSGKQKMWYAKQTDERMEFVKSLNNGEEISVSTEPKQDNKRSYDLFALTRTDNIRDNYSKYGIRDTKELAAIFRKHLRERFPMCKWSVRKVNHNSVDITLKSSPYAIDSDEVIAITEYAYRFANSYNYDNSDIMTDYFDVNFYGVSSRHSIVDKWDYIQTEPTVAEENISADFAGKLAEFNKQKEERRQREWEEEIRRQEEAEEKRKEWEKEAKKNHEIIENNADAKAAVPEYFVLGCLDTGNSKCDSVKDYFKEYEGLPLKNRRVNCQVAAEVYFSKDVYELFTNRMLDNYSFIGEDMGGSATDDLRVNSMQDYQRMSAEERETVEWYHVNCLAVFCDDELKLVIDPQGYSYARYVYFVDEESHVATKHHGDSGISEEGMMADILEDAVEEIITDNGISNTFDGADFDVFKKEIKSWIRKNKFPLSENAIRASRIEQFKSAMYRILDEIDSVEEQFYNADLKPGQAITIILFDEIGQMAKWHGYFNIYEVRDYAQHKDSVFLYFRMNGKQKEGRTILYNGKRCLIYDGFVDFPEDVLWDVWTNDVGWVMRKTKYGSCDNKQFDAIYEYFDSKGIQPIINTYKPQF